ncbi:MAG: hypothetical protein ACK4S3_07120 [Parvibaculum sp.]
MDRNDIPLVAVGCFLAGSVFGMLATTHTLGFIRPEDAASWFQVAATLIGVGAAGLGIYWQASRQMATAREKERKAMEPLARAVRRALIRILIDAKQLAGSVSVLVPHVGDDEDMLHFVAAVCRPIRDERLRNHDAQLGALGPIADELWLILEESQRANEIIRAAGNGDQIAQGPIRTGHIQLMEAIAERCAFVSINGLENLEAATGDPKTERRRWESFGLAAYEGGIRAARAYLGMN